MKTTAVMLAALGVIALGGIWLFVAPFGVGYQALGASWTTATRNDLATGGALTVTGLVSLVAYAGLAARDLLRRGPRSTQGDAPGQAAPQVGTLGEHGESGQ